MLVKQIEIFFYLFQLDGKTDRRSIYKFTITKITNLFFSHLMFSQTRYNELKVTLLKFVTIANIFAVNQCYFGPKK
jgi:hypothetical protein